MVSLRALVDFISPREDEFIYATVSFLKQRFQTPAHSANAEVIFNDEDATFLFEFTNEGDTKFDPALLLKLNQTLHLTILKQRKNEKAVVMGTKNLDWRAVLHSNSVEINAEILPIDLAKTGALCVAQLHLDLLPALSSKAEALSEEAVVKQQSLERRYESEALQQFLEYANNWWTEYKAIRHAHKTRLVKIFAETDDREASVYKPVCQMV